MFVPISNEVDSPHAPTPRNLNHRHPHRAIRAILDHPLLPPIGEGVVRSPRCGTEMKRDKVGEHAESGRRVDGEGCGLLGG